MNLIDLKYAGILSTRTERFVVKSNSPYRANLRCPICGDSKTSKSKARGWILEKDNSAIFYCHNCGASLPMRKLLERVNPALYQEYVVDMALERTLTRTPREAIKPLDKLTMKQPKFHPSSSPLRKIQKISQLRAGHGARDYVMRRKIPTKEHYRIYFVPKFAKWVNSMLPGKLDRENDKPRLILPFLDKTGRMFGFQGRSFDPKEKLRYITIMLDDDFPKIFGIDKIDFESKYYIVEGPIDSLFLHNCVAMAGSDGNTLGVENPDNGVFVFDNEPRNTQIVDKMDKCLKRGHKVCIWPSNIVANDINDMVLSGFKAAEIQLIIDQNTYQGLQGTLELSHWRKC